MFIRGTEAIASGSSPMEWCTSPSIGTTLLVTSKAGWSLSLDRVIAWWHCVFLILLDYVVLCFACDSLIGIVLYIRLRSVQRRNSYLSHSLHRFYFYNPLLTLNPVNICQNYLFSSFSLRNISPTVSHRTLFSLPAKYTTLWHLQAHSIFLYAIHMPLYSLLQTCNISISRGINHPMEIAGLRSIM